MRVFDSVRFPPIDHCARLSVCCEQELVTEKDCGISNCISSVSVGFSALPKGFSMLMLAIRLDAAATPEKLSQEDIIENLDPAEAARLNKVRNIGIAV